MLSPGSKAKAIPRADGCAEMPLPWENLPAEPSYCTDKAGTSASLMTGGGFHLPVSASDF